MSNFDGLKNSLNFTSTLLSTIKFLPQEVSAHLSLIDVSNVCGPDLITGFLLKNGVEVLAPPLSYLFNTSMCTATLPTDWVTTKLLMLFLYLNVMINQLSRIIGPSVLILWF